LRLLHLRSESDFARDSRIMTATIHRIGPEKEPSLDPLIALIAGDMNQVNAVILDRMQSHVPLIPELAGHLIAGGGKRMRPMLTLACARLLDYPGGRQFKLAATVEFTLQLCSTMMSLISRGFVADAIPRTQFGVIRQVCWSVISSSAARLN
jgi:hypothetical protein